MNATTKNSLKSALLLIAIAVVAVVALALANALLPKYTPKLDIAKVAQLNAMLPTGISDDAAFEESYFTMAEDVDIEAFNAANGSETDYALSVYYAAEKEGWQYSGSIIIESRTASYGSGGIIMLTSIKDGKINGIHMIKQSESPGTDYPDVFSAANFPKIKELVIGKDAVTVNEVQGLIGTGSTRSVRGAINNIMLSVNMYNFIKGGA